VDGQTLTNRAKGTTIPCMKDCVAGWSKDESLDGSAHDMVPVFCSDIRKSLSLNGKALIGLIRDEIQAFKSSTDSEILSAAKKLLEAPDDVPETTCNKFFLIPQVVFTPSGKMIRSHLTLKCSEDIGHSGVCVSSDGWVGPGRVA